MLVYAGQHHRRKVRDSLLIYCRIDGEECTLKAIWEAQESRLSRDKTRSMYRTTCFKIKTARRPERPLVSTKRRRPAYKTVLLSIFVVESHPWAKEIALRFYGFCSQPMELATCENTVLELDPISRRVPTTIIRITATITAYSAMSCPSSEERSMQS